MKKKKSTPSAKIHPEPNPALLKIVSSRLPATALIVLVCLVVYYNALSNGFAFDDLGVIVNNAYLKRPGQFLAALFNLSYFKVAGLEASYRPLATLSYLFIYWFAGLNPFYYHLLSLVLHALAAVLVYRLADGIFENHLQALLAGLLFAVHPVLTEAVDCITFNEDLLAGVFFIASLLLYIQTRVGSAAVASRNYWLALILYFLGLLSKEMAITLPAVIVLYDLVLRDRRPDGITLKRTRAIVKQRIAFYAGFAAVSLVYLGIRFLIIISPGGTMHFSYGSLWQRLIFLPWHLLHFVKLALLPYPLTADYVFAYPASFWEASNLIGLAVVAGLLAISIPVYHRSKPIFFGIWWFLITLLPVSNLIEIYNPIAERYLYIPVIGFCLVVPVLISALAARCFARPATATAAALIPLAGILGVYAWLTIARNADWKDNFTLWTQTLQTTPNSAVAHGNLGRAYQDRRQLDEARKHFKIAIGLDPQDFKSYYNLGLVYFQKGDPDRAIKYFKRSIALNPDCFNCHYNLAMLYHKQGHLEPAIAHYLKLIALKPENFAAHNNLGFAYAMQGRLKRAIAQWEIAHRLDPQNSQVVQNIQKARRLLQNSGSFN